MLLEVIERLEYLHLEPLLFECASPMRESVSSLPPFMNHTDDPVNDLPRLVTYSQPRYHDHGKHPER
jgi:hypothetical protein